MSQKILLHCCCAPDATHSINVLRELNYYIVTFFYNPNIHPKDEYKKRLNDMKKLSDIMHFENVEDVLYNTETWHKLCGEFKNEKEGGKRCEICFKMRIEETAKKAIELKINTFATTLTISPHKNANLINNIGKDIEEKYGIKYLETNFKKKDGFKKSIILSRQYNLYRQNYCGCIYSLNIKG